MTHEERMTRAAAYAAWQAKAVAADVLVSELEKVRDKLPKEAKNALDKHAKKKGGEKQ